MKRFGSVLVFKAGITKAQATAALKKIEALLDLPSQSYVIRDHKYVVVPFTLDRNVNEFDDECGGPVWYVP